MKLFVLNVRISIIVVTLLLCVGWGIGAWFYEVNQFNIHSNSAIDKEYEYAGIRGQTISADFRRSLRIMYGLPEVLASWHEIIDEFNTNAHPSNEALKSPQQRILHIKEQEKLPKIRHVEQLLALAKNDFSADVIWLVDLNGDCLAASNFDMPGSFVGFNYKDRAYFSVAVQGGNGYQFAVGKVSKQAGLYFSAPVYANDAIVGVIVVKVDMARLAHNIDITNTIVVDENGVVILSDQKSMEMKAVPNADIYKLSAEKRSAIYQRSKFDQISIQPWPDAHFSRLIKVENSSEAYVLNITNINAGQLKIYVLAPAKEILSLEKDYFRLFLLITLSGSGLVIIAGVMISYAYSNYVTRKILQLQQDDLSYAQHLAQMGSWSYDYLTEQLYCSEELITQFFLLKETNKKPTTQDMLMNIHPEDRERVKKVHEHGIKSGEGYQVEYRLVLPDGEIHHIVAKTVVSKNEKGQRLKISGTCKDVTEELRTFHAIEASERHLRKLIDSSLIGIIQGDTNGIILDMNNAFMQLTGYTHQHIEERELAWQDLASDDYRQLDSPKIFSENSTSVPFEMDLKCHDGRIISTLIGMTRIQDMRGEWVCFILDQSERNRINRLKSEFISVVSHELRTPLTSIRGSLALLEAGVAGALPAKGLELIQIAHRNSRRLIGIVNDILDMEKLEAGKMVFEMNAVEIIALINQAIEFNESFASSLKVSIVLRDHPNSAHIWGDGNRLMQVLTNLISNAIKFSPSGGEVELAVLKIEHSWRIEVRDKGVGIPEAFRSRIFGTFAQAEDANTRQKGGTGLGLNISKTMVEKMDGKIGFESEENKGSTFWVMFAAM